MSIRTRVGQGFDIHRFIEGSSDRVLVLGGVKFPSEKPLAGHSDADVIAHAAADALLGAASLGDIGMHFPDTDPQWAGADSLTLLAVGGNGGGFAGANNLTASGATAVTSEIGRAHV